VLDLLSADGAARGGVEREPKRPLDPFRAIRLGARSLLAVGAFWMFNGRLPWRMGFESPLEVVNCEGSTPPHGVSKLSEPHVGTFTNLPVPHHEAQAGLLRRLSGARRKRAPLAAPVLAGASTG
jgi:hypothetical protein